MDKKATVIVVVMAALLLGGCAKPTVVYKSSSTSSTSLQVYDTQYPLTTQEYVLFLNKEIVPVTDQLTTHILLIKNINKGSYPLEDALEAAKESLKMITECKEAVNVTQPPEKYDDVRNDVLEKLADVEGTFEAYIKELETGSPDTEVLTSCAELMQSDFNIITSKFSVYWK